VALSPASGDYSLLLHSPQARARASSAAAPNSNSVADGRLDFASGNSFPGRGPAPPTPLSLHSPNPPAVTAPLTPLCRSSSFGSLSASAAPLWVSAAAERDAAARQSFLVSELRRENSQLAAQLEEARLTIADLRYAAMRREAAHESALARERENCSAAEQSSLSMFTRLVHQRSVVRAYRTLLLHVSMTAYARAYLVKKSMVGLAARMQTLAMMVRAARDERTGPGALGESLPQSELLAFAAAGVSVWRSVARVPSSVLLSNLLDGVDGRRAVRTEPTAGARQSGAQGRPQLRGVRTR